MTARQAASAAHAGVMARHLGGRTCAGMATAIVTALALIVAAAWVAL